MTNSTHLPDTLEALALAAKKTAEEPTTSRYVHTPIPAFVEPATRLPLAFPRRLNDLTREEIADIRLKHTPKLKHCAWCDKEKEMRSDQKFCCDKCRVASSRAMTRIQLESRARMEELWHQERAELIHEISQLRAELILLRKRTGEGI